MDYTVYAKMAQLLATKEALVDRLRVALSILAPDQQPRWHKGAAQLIYTFVVVCTCTLTYYPSC